MVIVAPVQPPQAMMDQKFKDLNHSQVMSGLTGQGFMSMTANHKEAGSIGALEDMNQSALSMSQAMLHNNTSYYGTKDLMEEIDTRDGRVSSVVKGRTRQELENDTANQSMHATMQSINQAFKLDELPKNLNNSAVDFESGS
jgi:hypothetical protein